MCEIFTYGFRLPSSWILPALAHEAQKRGSGGNMDCRDVGGKYFGTGLPILSDVVGTYMGHSGDDHSRER